MQRENDEAKLLLEVHTENGVKRKVLEKDSENFSVSGLVPGTKYEIKVTAKNQHGRSKPLYLEVETFLLPSELIAETKTKEDNSSDESSSSLMPVLVTCSGLLLSAMIFMTIFLTMRSRNTMRSTVVSTTLIPKSSSTDQENLAASLDCENSFTFTADNQVLETII